MTVHENETRQENAGEMPLTSPGSTLSPLGGKRQGVAQLRGDNVGFMEFGVGDNTPQMESSPAGDEPDPICQRVHQIETEARKQLAGWDRDSVSSKTRLRYLTVVDRMLRENKTPATAAKNRKTYGYQRSAVAWGARWHIDSLLDPLSVDSIRDDPWQLADLLHQLEAHTQLAIDYPMNPDHPQGEWKSLGRLDERVRSTKKRLTATVLTRLQLNRFFKAIEGWAYQPAAAVLMLSGCRPVELEQPHGVTVIRCRESVELQIKGAKLGVHGRHGQPERCLRFPLNTVEAQYLHRYGSDQGVVVAVKSAHLFGKAVGRLAKKIWPDDKLGITAYSFRHSAAARFKAHLGDVEVAMALGHRTDLTQQWYGLARQWSGGNVGVPNEVKASEPVVKKAVAKRALLGREPDSSTYGISP